MGLKVRISICLAGLSFMILAAGCDFVPKGATIIKVSGRKEYDKGQLQYKSGGLENREPIKLKWVDTNTWITTATIDPGQYKFVARTFEGKYYANDVLISTSEKKYVLPEHTPAAGQILEGPKISGGLQLPVGTRQPRELVILFIGQDITMKRVPVADGKWSTTAPSKGSFRIEIHALGEKPKSYVREPAPIESPIDLGMITLK